MKRFVSVIRKFGSETEGAAIVEYGLLILLIAVLCIVAIRVLGSSISNTMNSASNQMP
jgi:Flp pilus assembly pilin Flp